jgi:hypothetical protein
MRRLVTVAGAVVAAIAIAAQDSHAQMNAPVRDGFFIGLGLGGGSFGCSGCVDRQSGMSGHLKLGTALNSQWLAGVESSAWTKEEGGARLTHANLSAMAQFYPVATNGFFLRAGVGVSSLEASVPGFGSGRETGLGLTAGLGYDVRVGSNFSVSPYGTFGGGDHEGGSANTFQLGLGVTWH